MAKPMIFNAPEILNPLHSSSLTTEQEDILIRILKIKKEEIPLYYRASDCTILDYQTLSRLERALNNMWGQAQDISFLLSIPDFCQFVCKTPRFIEELIKVTVTYKNHNYQTHVKNIEFLIDNFLNQLSFQDKQIKERQQHSLLLPLCEYLVEVYYRSEKHQDTALMNKASLLFSRVLLNFQDFVLNFNPGYIIDKPSYAAIKLLPCLEKAAFYDKQELKEKNELISQIWSIVEPQIQNIWSNHLSEFCNALFKKLTPNHHSFWIIEKFVHNNPDLAFSSLSNTPRPLDSIINNYYYFFKEKIKDLDILEKNKIILACFNFLNNERLIELSSQPFVPAQDIYTAFNTNDYHRNRNAYDNISNYKTILRSRLDKETLTQALPLPQTASRLPNKI